MIKKGTLELINNTPLVVLDKIVDGRVIYAKAEFMKPGGRAKFAEEIGGFYAGYSSGANVAAAIKYMEKNPEFKYVVTILCDTGYKYSDL